MDDLNKQLEIYRENYARYRVTGDVNAKARADMALASANDIIRHQQTLYEQGTTYIQNFIDSFKETNPDLITLHQKASTIERELPELQNEFVQTQKMNESSILHTIDYTPYLIKGGVVVVLVIIGALASTF